MDFVKAKDTYRKNAIVQRKMAKKLVFETLKFGDRFQNIFEIGSGTGLLTDEIISNFSFEKIFLNDITDNFTGVVPFRYYKGNILDIECEALEVSKTGKVNAAGFDLIMSNAVFQWINDKELLFSKIFRFMTKGGILSFTTFGEENFSQIKNISGFGLEYPDRGDIFPLLKKIGFEILFFEEELETLYFESVQKILEHIKLTGVGTGANCLWTRKKYEAFKKEYLKHFSDANGVELTYHPQYYILRKTG